MQLHAGNVGIGPAHVRDFRVTVDGVLQATWTDAVRELTGRDEDELREEYEERAVEQLERRLIFGAFVEALLNSVDQ